MRDRPVSFSRRWALPVALLSGAALASFWLLYSVDHLLAGESQAARGALERYLRFDPHAITDAISSLAGVVAAVLGIVITVVSIVVQLSAGRYAGVTRMFLRDRVNLGVMAYYVVVCVCGVWLSVALQEDYVPRVALIAMLVATSGALVLMVPYFGYVFWFLEPMNIIERIRQSALSAATRGSAEHDQQAAFRAQAATLAGMEELTDITSGSISGKDKIIASGAVDALKDLALGYLDAKGRAQPHWFAVGAQIRENPDFVAMDPESLQDLEQRRTWVEWKVMRQYLGIYNEALSGMRDINYLIAIDTRYLGEKAAAANDHELVRLVYRYMNSYLRATLNARDVRTAYNVLNQYRLLVESMLRAGSGAAALEGLRHMIYYGHVSFDMKLTFVTETVAYDVSSLCQVAHERNLAEEAAMLDSFLELDRPLRTQSQESALVGVRKAQVKLAAHYLHAGDAAKARRIADDMSHEPLERLRAIQGALGRVETKDFWEIIDRGRNFEYMPAGPRACLPEFFGWLGVGADEEERVSREVVVP
jgi:hypothetical protein